MKEVPELSIEEFSHPFLVDLRSLDFIPYIKEYWFDVISKKLTLKEERLLSYVRVKEWPAKGWGCTASNEDLQMILGGVEEKTVQNMIARLIKSGYLKRKFGKGRHLFALVPKGSGEINV